MKTFTLIMEGGRMVSGKEELMKCLTEGSHTVMIMPDDVWAEAYKLVGEYHERSDAMEIPELLDLNDKLTTICATLSAQTGKSVGMQSRTYVSRKIARSKRISAMVKDMGMTKTMAEAEADAHIEAQLMAEAEAEEQAATQKMVLESFWRISGAITQRISHLKQEFRNERVQ